MKYIFVSFFFGKIDFPFVGFFGKNYFPLGRFIELFVVLILMENSWENFAFFCFYWFNFAVFLSCEKGKFKSFSILGRRPHLCQFLFILLLRKLLLNLGDHENALHFNIKRVFKPCEVKQDENLHLNRARRLLNCFKRHKVQSDDNLFKKILYPPFESLKILSLCLSLQ